MQYVHAIIILGRHTNITADHNIVIIQRYTFVHIIIKHIGVFNLRTHVLSLDADLMCI